MENDGYMKSIRNFVPKSCELFEFIFGNNPYHTQYLSEEHRIESATRFGNCISLYKSTEKTD